MIHISLAQKINAAFALALVFVATIGVASYFSARQVRQNVSEVDRTNAVLQGLGMMLSDLQDVETGTRGYVITGNPAYLEPYTAGAAAAPLELSSLRELTAGDRSQQDRLDALQPLVTQRIDLASGTIALRRDGGFEAARAHVETGEGKAVMDEIRALIDQMDSYQTGLLNRGNANAKAVSTRAEYVVVVGGLLAVAVVAFALVSIKLQMRRRRRAVEELNRFFSLSVDMLCIGGFDGYFKRVNDAWEETLGWTSEEMTAKPWSYFVHPDDLERTIEEADKQTEQGLEAISFENRYLAKDGSYHWLLWNSRPSAEHGEMHSVARDVTEQKEAANVLRESEARHRTVVDNIADGVIAIDAQGHVESFNHAAERLFGYAASEVIGQNVKMLMPEPYYGEHDQYLDNYLSGGPKKVIGIGREVEGRRRDGERFPMDLAISEIALGDRRVFVGITRDISERKRAENALRDLNATLEQQVAERTEVAEQRTEELVKINGELEAFTYSVSHDLKEPLRTVEAFSQFLLEDYADKLDAEGKDHLTRLAQASARMKQLIENLLALSRIGRVTEPPAPTDVGRIVSAVVEGMRATLAERHASVEVADDIPRVLADPTRIEQIFGNLIGNGIKFNQSDAPRVTVGVRGIEDGQVVLYVRDNGIGIDPQYHGRIFGIFQRLHRREEYEGTGAGLAIVQRSVDTLGGRIWVESEPGAGTTFLFTLPLAAGESTGERIAA